MYKFIKRPFFGRFMVKWQSPLENEQKRVWQIITTKSKSGATIYGYFAKTTCEQAKATIVLGHPMGKEAKGYFLKNSYTDLLRSNGYNTLVFDLNGFGESTHGNFSYFEDIVAIGNKASTLTPGIPIGYHGISLGAQMAIIAFADPAHKYEFAIIESAATSLDEFWIKVPPAYITLKILNFFLPKFRKKIRMIDRVKDVKKLRSLLLIYSKADTWTPVEMGIRLRENSPVPTELWIVENAKHAAIMKSEHKAEYENKIISFFDTQLMIK